MRKLSLLLALLLALTACAPADGILLYQCSSLNIIKDGPMISYGVPAEGETL